jgi:chromate transporter
VVGVVLNLALFFGYHLLWPEGFASAFDVRSALIALGAAVALFHYKRSVMEVIVFCALMGLTIKLLPL